MQIGRSQKALALLRSWRKKSEGDLVVLRKYHHKLRHRISCMETIRHMEKND